MIKAMFTGSMVVVILFHCTSACAEEVRVESSPIQAEPPPLAIAPPPEAPNDEVVKAIEPTGQEIETLRKIYASLVVEESKLLSMQELEKQIREKEAAMLLRKANALLERLVAEYGTTAAANEACGMLQKGKPIGPATSHAQPAVSLGFSVDAGQPPRLELALPPSTRFGLE